ncbi:uncharacterized protein METZ01_LOCUS2920 [marine metagenome]|jgi:hypothetical protein|uniref:Uncharacterized protein n=1 Tax=marine metagenome TaxID=408172 RepID=A0A381N621_9ZZZZ|tara:strand:- start:121 stop:222 length:102 start_codon:yes stop_codon:yes gene_type:complete
MKGGITANGKEKEEGSQEEEGREEEVALQIQRH